MREIFAFRTLFAAAALVVAAGAQAPQPIGDVLASDSTIRGSVVLASGAPRLTSGSAVTAGNAAALVRLDRGGQVRVCPGTTLTVAGSGTGSGLMLSLSDGALETRYVIPALSDTIMTPDFRLLLVGPGSFDVAVRSNSKGDLCVESRSDSASVLVSEQLGDGVYQVRARDSILFRGGKVAGAEPQAGGCGCPPPPATELRAQLAPPPPPPPPAVQAEPKAPASHLPEAPATPDATTAAAIAENSKTVLPPVSSEGALSAPPPPLQPNELHVVVDAPFVFNASAPPPEAIPVQLALTSAPLVQFPLPEVQTPAGSPPPEQPALIGSKPQKKKGFFGRIRGFFAAVFGAN